MTIDEQKRELALDLYDIGALKFGDFTFKSGIKSPMYLDQRLYISYPRVMKKVVKLYVQLLEGIEYDRLAGVAYGALPVTGALSLELEKPWVYVRKEGLKKEHGLQKSMEGEYHAGEVAVMIEDIITRGTSLLEAIPTIEQQGLVVKDAVVLVDYGKGGPELVEKAGYKVHSFITIREIVDIMHSEGKIDDSYYQKCVDFLAQ